MRSRNPVGHRQVVSNILGFIDKAKIADRFDFGLVPRIGRFLTKHQDRTRLMISTQQSHDFRSRFFKRHTANINLRFKIWIEVNQPLEDGAVWAVIWCAVSVSESRSKKEKSVFHGPPANLRQPAANDNTQPSARRSSSAGVSMVSSGVLPTPLNICNRITFSVYDAKSGSQPDPPAVHA